MNVATSYFGMLIVLAATSVAPAVAGQAPGPTPAKRAASAPRPRAVVTGEPKQWHKVTLTVEGPFARETDTAPNPFLDYRFVVLFVHESGAPAYSVPGYFAADGRAGESSADAGSSWRVHLSPDKAGTWHYQVTFLKGPNAAVEFGQRTEAVRPLHDMKGSFTVAPSDKTGRDFRSQGRLEYVGGHHLRFAGSKAYFLKAGADSPETLLAYADFDGTVARKPTVPLKTWAPHVRDWADGDPTWKGGRGKGLIGAINYLAAKGMNAISFLTYNAGGDGDNVWPFVERDDKLHYDCSKLDQWQVAFDHAQARGVYLHFKTQETEIDDHVVGRDKAQVVPEALDAGELGRERKLYYRELVARFGYALALNWNLGEENTQTTAQRLAMAKYLRETDPYPHHIVIHTYPEDQDAVYPGLLGPESSLTGASLQNSWENAHQRVLKWREASASAGKPWVVASDEQNPADFGLPPDAGYDGFDGVATGDDGRKYDRHDVRRFTLWGNLTAGGAGVEYYFGYKAPQGDLGCEDWRSRDASWDTARLAIELFSRERIPFWEMANADALVGNVARVNGPFALAKAGEVYLVYLPAGGTHSLDLGGTTGSFRVSWYDPRRGGDLVAGPVTSVAGGTVVSLGTPPRDPGEDWVVLVRR